MTTEIEIEQLYKLENDMLYAVETGNIERFKYIVNEKFPLLSTLPDRYPNDPIRSKKNSCIVLNTLLRKASEKGGLHPFYLDNISTKYAIKIEKCSSIQELVQLVTFMQNEYIDSVIRLSLKNYSKNIRKAIEYIRINLKEKLTLNIISSALSLSPFELSRQFKKETGENITEYINKRRISESIYILENEQLSITNVALLVGFNDSDYFSKVFKKYTGVLPSQYKRKK